MDGRSQKHIMKLKLDLIEKFGKNIKLNQEKINQYIPINPHRCSTIGVYKLSEKLPNYWEKFVIEDSAILFDI